MTENEELWREENEEQVTADAPGMRSVGVTAGGIGSDLETFDIADEPTEEPEAGAEPAAEPEAGAAEPAVTPPPV